MKCSKPYRAAGQEFACRQCLPCRLTRQKLWAARLYWELSLHAESYFITLTYNDESLPESGSLVKRHVQLFLKRLRKHASFRYFVVGEYGDRSWRPHYHGILFGFPLRAVDKVQECWKYGYVHIGTAERGSLKYITGYCTKGMTGGPLAVEKLGPRIPEFVRMSLRPGIGAGIVDTIPLHHNGVALADILGGQDVPGVLRLDGRPEFMGTYLRNRLRVRLGRAKGCVPEELAVRVREFLSATKVDSEVEKMRAARAFAAGKAAARDSINRVKRLKI